jgi:hypothetical protein
VWNAIVAAAPGKAERMRKVVAITVVLTMLGSKRGKRHIAAAARNATVGGRCGGPSLIPQLLIPRLDPGRGRGGSLIEHAAERSDPL